MREQQIHRLVISALHCSGVCVIHVPMGGKRTQNSGRVMRSLGAPRGFPDLVILDPPPALPDKVGTALELKTVGGRLAPEQKVWMHRLKERGWHVGVTYGDEQAFAFLTEAGYLPATPSH